MKSRLFRFPPKSPSWIASLTMVALDSSAGVRRRRIGGNRWRSIHSGVRRAASADSADIITGKTDTASKKRTRHNEKMELFRELIAAMRNITNRDDINCWFNTCAIDYRFNTYGINYWFDICGIDYWVDTCAINYWFNTCAINFWFDACAINYWFDTCAINFWFNNCAIDYWVDTFAINFWFNTCAINFWLHTCAINFCFNNYAIDYWVDTCAINFWINVWVATTGSTSVSSTTGLTPVPSTTVSTPVPSTTVSTPVSSTTACTLLGASSNLTKLKWHEQSIKWKNILTALQSTPRGTLEQGLSQIMMFDDDNFLIGEGSSGTRVYVGLLKDGREAAVKKVLMNHAERMNETSLLPSLQHKNIESFLIAEDANGLLYIANSLCDYTLQQWLIEVMKQPSWNNLIPDRVKDLLQALGYLHTQLHHTVVHCDLTPENILVVYHNGAYCLKLGDFGISVEVPSGQAGYCSAPAGTLCWKAREVLCPVLGCVTYTTSSDIQGAGMVSFYMMSERRHPYQAACHSDIEANIVSDTPHLSTVRDRVAVDFVKPMLAANPTDRPSADVLLKHGYLWSSDKCFQFLAAVGDETEIATYGSKKWRNSATAVAIERTKTKVLPTGMTNWGSLTVMQMLGGQFKDDFKKAFKKPTPHKYTESMCHLLRTLRNIQSHFHEQSATAQAILGNTRYPYAYFDQELPELFPEVYFIIRDTAGQSDDWTQRNELKKYF
ncbi:hypothetical protein LSAT2_008802 [Lamellibrachia satsuma]|nr:hypothetical protein LSAT2_008802 [Lamellibrachia satsuma]